MSKIKHPIIIVDGGDGTGKTTLAKTIGGHYLHASYLDTAKGNMIEYHLNLLKAAVILSDFEPVVIDRWRMSEVVYGTVFRGAVEGPTWTEPLYRLADMIGAIFVNCQPYNERLYLDTFNELKTQRVEMYDKMNEVYKIYARAIKDLKSVRSPLIYDRFKSDPHDASRVILKHALKMMASSHVVDDPVRRIDVIFNSVMLSKTDV